MTKTEPEKKLIKEHPYSIIIHLRISVILIILSVMQQVLYHPQNVLQIIGSLGINALYVMFFLSYALSLYNNFWFRINSRSVYILKGVFIRKSFRIPFEKVCTVVFHRDLFSTIFGAEKISADTPAGSGKKFDAGAFFSIKKAREVLQSAHNDQKAVSYYHSKTISIFLMSAFRSNPVTGLIFIVPIIQSLGKVIGTETTNALVRSSINSQWNFWNKFISPAAATLTAVILLSWTISLLLGFLRYVRFHSYRLGEFIVIYRGFPSRNITFTKLGELASVNVDQSLLMRFLKLKSCSLSVIGSGKLKGDKGMIISAEKSKKVYQKIHELTGINTDEEKVVHVSKRSLYSYIYLPMISLLIPLGISLLHFIFPKLRETLNFLAFISLIVIVWWFMFRIFAYRHSSIAINKDHLIVCGFRKLTLRKNYIKLDKIQKIEITQSIFQKQSGKCSVKVFVFFEKKNVCRVKQLPLKETAALLRNMENLY